MLEVTYIENGRLRYALTTSLQSALMLRADLAKSGIRARVWWGAVQVTTGAKQ